MAAIKKNTNLTMEEKISIFEYKEKNNSASFADIRQGVHEYDIIHQNFIYKFKVRISDLLRPHSAEFCFESDEDVVILELVPPEAEVKKALPLPAKDEPKKKRKQPIITDFFRKNKVYKQ